MTKQIKQYINLSIDVKKKILEDKEIISNINDLSNKCLEALKKGGKIIFAGNGGSFGDTQHISAEFTSKFLFDREPLASIALATNNSAITAIGNDFGYDVLFQRMTDTLGKSGDVLLGITTSGNSKNVNLAFKAAKNKNITTFGFLGSNGGDSIKLCDEFFLVPSHETARIQECHITAGHILMEIIENNLLESDHIKLK